jgi:hypothetical protein
VVTEQAVRHVRHVRVRGQLAFVEPHEDVLPALSALFEGHRAASGTIGPLADLAVPLDQRALVQEHQNDRDAVETVVRRLAEQAG